MKRILTVACYILVPLLGMIWALGCSTSGSITGPGPDSTAAWTLNMDVQPYQVYADTGGAVVYCFLQYGDTLKAGYPLHFRAASESVSSSVITSIATSSTDSTGTSPAVYYHPNNYAGDTDTIFAVFYSTTQDTVAWDSVIVPIIHP